MTLLLTKKRGSSQIKKMSAIFSMIFFIYVAKDIGSNNDCSFETHPSILNIHEQSDRCTEPLKFEHIDSTFVHKSISKLQTKKVQELMAYLPRSLNPALNLLLKQFVTS